MTAAINGVLQRALYLQAMQQANEKEQELERFALGGAMLYPNHRQDICIVVQYDGLQQKWWIA